MKDGDTETSFLKGCRLSRTLLGSVRDAGSASTVTLPYDKVRDRTGPTGVGDTTDPD